MLGSRKAIYIKIYNKFSFPFMSNLILFILSYLAFLAPTPSKGGLCNFENCLQCSADNKTCTTCKPDYLFSKEYNECTYYKTCPTGKYLNYTTFLCENCEISCKSCTGPKEYQCLSCEDGYYPFYYQGLFKCLTCEPQFCMKCNELGMCNHCNEGYYLTSDRKCIPCKVKNCLNCDTNIDLCQNCSLGYTFVSTDNVCVLNGTCPTGTYPDKDMNCLKCHSSCKLCNGNTENDCLECKSNYYFNFTKCEPCSSECHTCKLDKSFCESCYTGMLLRGHSCVQQCDTDEYYDEIEGKCKNCARVCGRCEKEMNRCLECRDGYHFYLDQNYNCKLRCSPGTYVQLTALQIADYTKQYEFLLMENNNETSITSTISNYVCQRCGPQCKECRFAPGYCVTCPQDLYKHLTSCLKYCPAGTFVFTNYLTNDKFCIKCPTGCTSCLNASFCTGCTAGLRLTNNYCSYMGFKTGVCLDTEVRVGSFCMDYCPEGTMQVDKYCYCKPKCNSCVYDVNNIYQEEVLCSECRNQTLWSFDGDCVEDCPSDMISVINSYTTEVVNNATGANEKETKERKICLLACPIPMLEIWINGSRKCVKNCPIGSILIENRCLTQLCPLGFYLDLELFKTLNSSSAKLRVLASEPLQEFESVLNSRVLQQFNDTNQTNATSQSNVSIQSNATNQSNSSDQSNATSQSNTTSQSNASDQSNATNNSATGSNLTDGRTNITSNYSANFSSIYEKACVSCDENCADCLGPGMQNCTLCHSGLVLSVNSLSNTNISQIKVINSLYAINNDKYNEFSTILTLLKYANYLKLDVTCKKECEEGWFSPSNRYCILCVQNCSVCAPGLYKFKNLCLPSCPLDTTSNNNTFVCEVINDGFKLIIKIPKYYDYISYSRDTQGMLYLYNILNPNMMLPVSAVNCSLNMFGADGKLFDEFTSVFIQIRNADFQSYSFVIRREMLQPEASYQLRCNVTEAEKGRIVSGSITVNTRPRPKGVFLVDPKVGMAMETNFTVSFTHAENNEPYPLPYYYQLIRKIHNNMTLIGKGIDVVNNSKPAVEVPGMGLIYSVESLLRRSNISITVKFPYVKNFLNITLLLRVYNTYVDELFAQDFSLLPYQAVNNGTNNSSDGLSLVTTNYVNEMKKIWEVNTTRASEEKIVKNVFNDFNFSCDATEDCSGNGRCRALILFQNQKCICFQGFAGHNCLWTIQSLKESQEFVSTVLNELKNVSDNYEIVNIIESLSDLVDSYNKEDLNLSLYYLQNISNSLDTNVSKLTLVKALNNLIDVLEILTPTIFPEEHAALLMKFDQVLKLAIDSFTQDVIQISSVNINLNFSNIAGQIRSLSLLGESTESLLRLDMNYFQSNVTFYFNGPLSNLIKNESQSLYSNMLIRPANIFPQSMWNESRRFFSSVVSFSIRYINSDLESLVFKPDSKMTISIPKALRLSTAPEKPNDEEIFVCVFFDYFKGVWSTEGVKFLGETSDSIFCETSHLSDFAVQLTRNNQILDKYMPQLRGIYYRTTAGDVGRNIFIIILVFGLLNLILVLAHLAGQYSKRRLRLENMNAKGFHSPKERAKYNEKAVVVELDESKQNFAKVNNFFDSPQKSASDGLSPEYAKSPNQGYSPESNIVSINGENMREKLSLYPLFAYFSSLKYKDVPSEPRIYLLLCTWNFHLMQVALLLLLENSPKLCFAALFLATSAVFSYFLNFFLRATRLLNEQNLSSKLLVSLRWLVTLIIYSAIIFGTLADSNQDKVFNFCSLSFLILGCDIFVLDTATALVGYYFPFVRRIVAKRGFVF